MKTINQKIWICVAVCALSTTFGLLANTVKTNANAADDSQVIAQKAEVCAQDTLTKSAWEGNYGKDGYVIFANIKNGAYGGKHFGNQSGFYSSFYGDIGRAADEVIYGVNSFDRRHDAEQAYMSVYNDNTAGYGIDSKAPISRWNYTTVVWYGNGSTNLVNGLYAPGATKPMDYYAGSEGMVKNDTSLLFTLKDDSLTYVSIYIFDHVDVVGVGTISEDKAVDVMVYPTAKNAANLYAKVGTEGAANLDAFYGVKPIAKTTVTDDGTYVTFALQGAGDYQIVVADDNTDDNRVGDTRPTIGGFFFDSEMNRQAKVKSVDSVTGAEWKNVYGQDGYVVFNGKGTSSQGEDWRKNVSFYSDLYPDNDGMTVITGYNRIDRVYGNANYSYLTAADESAKNYGMSEPSPISRWGFGSECWWDGGYSEEFAAKFTLKNPTGDDYTYAAVGGNERYNHVNNNFSIFFSLKNDNKILVSIYLVDTLEQISEENYVNVSVYPTARLKLNNTKNENGIYGYGDLDTFYGAKPLVTAKVTTQCSYVTFELSGKGDYQIVASDKNVDNANKATTAPTMQGLFFKNIQYYDINYNLNGGVNSFENPTEFTDGETINLKPATKKGYNFDGWYTTEDFQEESKIEKITDINANITLYAKFSEQVRSEITYVLGEHVHKTEKMPDVYYEGVVTFLSDPTIDEYCIFNGWYTNENFSEESKVVKITEECKGNITLYAKITYVTFELTLNVENWETAYFDENHQQPVTGNNVLLFNYYETFKLPKLYFSDGREFEGWFEEDSFDTKLEELTAEEYNTDIEIYAKAVQSYTITYVLDGSENASENPVLYKDGEEVVFADSVKEGYTFLGWFDSETEGNKVTKIAKGTKGNITVYARFQKIDNSGDSSGDTTPDSGEGEKTEGNEKGCKGTVGASACICTALLGVIAVLSKKKKDL